MMQMIRYGTLVVLLLSLGCAHLSQPVAPSAEQLEAEKEHARHEAEEQARSEAGTALRRATLLVEKRELKEAEQLVTPLLTSPEFAEAAGKLRDQIGHLRKKSLLETTQRESESRALLEVESALILPEKYGQTVVIAPEQTPLQIPPGPMERLAQRKVTMSLQNTGVKDLVMTLSQIDGLNIIADEALTATKKLSISVKDVPLTEVLGYIARNMGIAFHLGQNTIWVTKSTAPADSGPKLETRIFPLRRGFIPKLDNAGGMGVGSGLGLEKAAAAGQDDQDLEEALKTFLDGQTPGASYKLFRNRNLLIVRNTREKLRLVEDLLLSLDTSPLQVLIEARFVTLKQEDLFKLGVNIQNLIIPPGGEKVTFQDLKNRTDEDADVVVKSGYVVDRAESIDLSKGLSERVLEATGNTPGSLTLSGILGNLTYQATLDAIRQVGSSRTLSAPRVTVTNNHPAYIFRGTKRYYFEQYEIQTLDKGTDGDLAQIVPTGTPKELPEGLFLSVLPSIGNDHKTLILALKPELKEFVKFEEFGDNGLVKLPIVNENSVSTTVVINSGETVVLGGMINKSESQNVQKVPVLGDIPFLGFLFRQKETSSNPEHLLIFVTAKIIDPSGKYVRVAASPAEVR
jgi:type IV pilus assembly protein PilQ